MASRGRAKLAIDHGVSTWVLEAPDGFGDGDFHGHHAIQLTICFDGELTLIGEDGPISAEMLGVAPDAKHKLQAHGLIGIIFIEPESTLGRMLNQLLFQDAPLATIENSNFRKVADELRHAIADNLTSSEMLQCARAAVQVLAPAQGPQAFDARMDAILAYLAEHLDHPLTLHAAARGAGVYLSSSRLRHLFVEQTGLAFKTYVLWVRLVRAVQVYSGGNSLTDAAHAAGFADSAHFSRIFKRTFGAPATTLTRV